MNTPMSHDAPPPEPPEPLLSRETLRLRFDEVVRAHGPKLRRFLLRYTGDTHHADDLAQEAFVRAYARLDRFDDRRPFAPWLFTLAANLGRDFIRRRARHAGREHALDDAPEPACPAPGPGATLDAHERRAALDQAIAMLPDGLREPLLLHYELGWPLAAVATHLGVEEGAVKVRLHRARRRLHEMLTRSETSHPAPAIAVSPAPASPTAPSPPRPAP